MLAKEAIGKPLYGINVPAQDCARQFRHDRRPVRQTVGSILASLLIAQDMAEEDSYFQSLSINPRGRALSKCRGEGFRKLLTQLFQLLAF